MREKQYGILDENGVQVASIWATSVVAIDDAVGGFWFKRGSDIVAAAWYGYKDVETNTRYYTPKRYQFWGQPEERTLRAVERQDAFKDLIHSLRRTEPARKPAVSVLLDAAEDLVTEPEIHCQDCGGTGGDIGAIDGWEPCSHCQGSGREPLMLKPITAKVQIPEMP